MVNFKMLILPLLVGSLYVKAQETDTSSGEKCSILKSSNGYTATNCNGYYLLNELEGAVTVGDSGKLAKVGTNSVTYDKNPIPGFYKSDNDVVIQCTSSECSIITPVDVDTSDCGNDVGKYVSGKGLCLTKSGENCQYVDFVTQSQAQTPDTNTVTERKRAETEDKTYIIESSGDVFNFDKAMTYYAVKADETSIKLAIDYEGTDVCAANGEIISRVEDFCTAGSSGKYYTCKYGKCISRAQNEYDTIETNSRTCGISLTSGACTGATNCDASDDGYYYSIKGQKSVVCKYDNSATGDNYVEYKDNTRGYIWNEYQYNAFIECDGNACKPITLDVVTDCKDNVGKIVDTGYNIRFCESATSMVTLDDYFKVAKDLGYYVHKGIEGSGIFDNPEAYYPLIKEKNSLIVNTYIKKVTSSNEEYSCKNGICSNQMCTIRITTGSAIVCTATACKGSEYNGYRFVDANGAYVIDNSKGGFLINMNNGVCKVVSDVKYPGYYINEVGEVNYEIVNPNNSTETETKTIESLKGSYPLILCTSTQCTLKKYDEGYYYNQNFVNNNSTKPIIKCYDENCGTIDATQEIYANSGASLSLIYCKEKSETTPVTYTYDKCVVKTVSPNAYYAVKPISGGKVIKCGSDKCEENTVTDSIYIDGLANGNVIKCTSNGNCKSVEANTSTTNPVYFVDGSMDSATLGLIKCLKGTCNSIRGSNRLAYITKTSDKIIVCDNSGCEENGIYYTEEEKVAAEAITTTKRTDITKKYAYYLNGGDGNAIIKCTKENDEFKGCETITPTNNRLYINSNATGDNDKTNTFILCNTNCKEISADNVKNKFIDVPENSIVSWSNDSSKWEKASIHVIPDGGKRGYLVNADTYEILEKNIVNQKLVVCSSKGTGDSATVDCTIPSTSNYLNYYINGDSTSGVPKLIQKNPLSFLEPTKGYYINSSTDVIACENETLCSPATDVGSCDESNIGGIFKGKICTSNNVSTNTAGKYVLTLSNKLGVATSTSYLFTVSSNKMYVTNIESKVEYYFANESTNKLIDDKDKKGNVFECDKDYNICSQKKVKDGSNKTVYPNSDVSTYNKFVKIECTSDGCKSLAKGNNDIYCVTTKKTNNVLKVCSNDCSKVDEDSSSTCNELTFKEGYYLSDVDNTSLIKCNTSECTKYTPNEGYYLNQDISKPLILCSKTLGIVRCNYPETIATGYYISGEASTLVKCEAGSPATCSKVTVNASNNGWFVSGEKAITYCKSDGSCKADSMPAEGWYFNGNSDSEGKFLIKCTSKNNVFTCAETAIVNKGYYINSGKVNDNKQLIKCESDSKCDLEEVDIVTGHYYVNGENKQLIYCNKSKNCTPVNVSSSASFTTWYLTKDVDQLIGCTKSKVCTLYTEPSKVGSYMNGDQNTSNYPLIIYNEDQFILSNDYLEKGWYRNGDVSADASEMIIRCNSANSCAYREAKRSACSSIPGEFSILNGVSALVWCNTDGTSNKLEGDGTVTVAKFKKADVIPGVSLPEGVREAYALVKITQTEVKSTQIDGYIYSNGVLYFCPKRNGGVCTETTIEKGYYFDHNDSGKVYKCDGNTCDIIPEFDIVNDLADIVTERLYALDLKNEKFPGAGVSTKYILSNVSKYSVLFVEDIEEKCTECNDGGEISYEDCSKENIKYPYDTNKGYYIYNSGCKLEKVYIYKNVDKKEFKYECKIDGVCVKHELDEVPITGYKLSKDGVLQAEHDGTEADTEVVAQVLKGNYITKVGNEFKKINCNSKGDCEIKNINSNSITSDGRPKVNGIEGDTKHKKMVFQQKTTESLHKRDDDDDEYEYDTVLELTHVSYTSSSETRNIFVNSDNVMITDKDEGISKGYTCLEGKCSEIEESGNSRYYINTAQIGKPENAYVVCGGGSCLMKSCGPETNILVQNAAYQSIDDAIISCNSNGCEVISASSEVGLPKCKAAGQVIYNNGDDHFYKENGQQLLDTQYCILNGIIYSKEITSTNKISGKGPFLFDVAYEKLSISDVVENHINAAMYYCNGDGTNCKQTYGYLKNTNGYSICSKTGCVYKEKYEQSSCSLNGAGSLLSGNKLCKSYETPTEENPGTYALSIDVAGNFPEADISSKLLVNVEDEANYIVVEDGYVLLSSNNLLTSGTESSSNKLYQCTSNNMNCVEVVEPEYGYYKASNTAKAIVCNSNGCGISTIQSTNLFKSSIVYEYKESGFPGYEYVNVIVEKSMYKNVVLKVDNYILLNNDGLIPDDEVNSQNMYLCNKLIGKCSKQNIKDGWYISYKNNGYAIKCENEYCYSKELTKSCVGSGDLIYKDDYDLCETKQKYQKISDSIGKVVALTSSNSSPLVFPGKNSYISYGSNNVIGIGKANTGSSKDDNVYTPLSNCNSNSLKTTATECYESKTGDLKVSNINRYCKSEASNIIRLFQTGTDPQDSTKTKCLAKTGIVVLSGNKEIRGMDEGDDRKDGAQMYYCDSNSCRLTTGYYKGMKCDNNGCEYAAVVNSNGGWNESKLVINGNSVASTEGNYYYISGNNVFPGAETKESFLVQSVNDGYFIFKGDGYYLISDNKLLGVNENEEDVGKSGSLYLCNGSELTCKLVEKPENGYYLNAASSSANENVILCSGSSLCKLASVVKIADVPSSTLGELDVIQSNVTSVTCNTNTIGRMIRDVNKKSYKFCYSKSQTETFTTGSSKYYFMGLTNGNKFGGISLDSVASEAVNDTANVLIKFTNRSITQVNIDGHIIYNSSNKELIENVSTTTKGTVYYCQSAAYQTGSQEVTNQCNEVSNIKSGWYFNKYFKDKRYIKCVESQCLIAEAPEINICVNSGSLIYNNGKFKLCKSKSQQVDIDNVSKDYLVMMNVSYYNEFPSVKVNNTNIITNINPYNITLTKMESYVVVDSSNQNVIVRSSNEETSGSGLLYKCVSTGSCTKVELPNDNWYLKHGSNTVANELIKCVNGVCYINYIAEKGFYISNNIQMPLIQCIQPGVELDGEIEIVEGVNDKRVCIERKYNEGWYLNADKGSAGSSDSTAMIKCDAEFGCVETKITENGWYINSGYNFDNDKLSNSTIYPVIKCTSGNDCELYKTEIKKSCAKGGDLINVSGSTYKLCKNEKDSVDFTKVNGEVYQILTVSNYDDFPEATNGNVLVKVTKDRIVQVKGNGYYLKDKIMYLCSEGICEIINDSDSNGITVLENLTNTLYTSSCSNNSCSWTLYNAQGYVFISDKDGKEIIFNYKDYIEDENPLNNIKKVYYCRKNESNTLSCNEIDESGNGYMYNPNHKNSDGRIVNTLYNKNGNEYKKAESDDIRKCTVLTYNQNYCYISYANEPFIDEDNYDSGNHLPEPIQEGSVCATTNGKYYFATKEINTGIDEPNCVPLPSDNNVYYYTINNVVYSVDKYGIRNSNIQYSGKTITCSYDIKSGVCKLNSNSDSVNAGESCTSNEGVVYLALSKLSTSGGKCVRYVDNNNNYIDSNEPEHVTHDLTKQTYLIDNNVYSIYSSRVDKRKDNIFILDSINNEVSIIGNFKLNIDETSQYKLVVCNGDGCRIKNRCENGDDNEYMIIYDNNNNKVMKCDPKSNTISRITSPGYYLNSQWNNLIKCYNDGYCNEIAIKETMEGYYKDSGNDGKMIVCKRDGNNVNCSSEKMIECQYNESEGLCKSNVNLLRNSYCYFSKEDKVIGKVEKLIYIENFIKAKTEGKCIIGSEVDIYKKYKKSKFLGHDERDDLIRIRSDSIVSIYENDIGYYIIDTKEGKGLIETPKDLKKTRMYVCKKGNCVENVTPENGKIYVNKASSKMLIQYDKDNKQWNIIDNGCTKDLINTSKCNFSHKNEIGQYAIIYNVDHDIMTMYDIKTDGGVKERTTLVGDNGQAKLKKKTFIEYNDELYLYDVDGQSLTKQSNEGYYIFNKNENNINKYNLTPYKSTKNVTVSDSLEYYIWPEYYTLGDEGYYLNSADIDGLGLVLQKMKIPEKVNTKKNEETDGTEGDATEETESVEVHNKYKVIINKCTSTQKNICVNAQDGQTISEGSVCVVTEGEFKGLYLATDDIKKTSRLINCMKYDEELSTFKYIGKNNVIFTGIDFKNILVRVDKYSIEPLKHEYISTSNNDPVYDYGYYVLDENDLQFNSETLKNANAYECNLDKTLDESKSEIVTGYSCNLMTNANGYYLDKISKRVMYANNKKWKIETDTGYFFFNQDYLPATISIEDEREKLDDVSYSKSTGSVKLDLSGRYLNSAVKNNNILIVYDKADDDNESSSKISNELKLCQVKNDGTCTARNVEEELVQDDACYDPTTKKLYVVREEEVEAEGEDEESKTNVMCYTGSVDTIKYVLVDSNLYKLDGLSIKNVNSGYYILNDKMEAFSSKYPEKASKIIKCGDNNQCGEISEKLTLDQDVIINEAVIDETAPNKLLRFYKGELGEEKFMNVEKNGYYCFDGEGMLPTEDDGNSQYAYCWKKNNNGLIKIKPYTGDICINQAKRNSNIALYGGQSKELSGITYNSEKDAIEFENEYNLNNKVVFKFYDNKLFKLRSDRLDQVLSGLYLMQDGKPFTNNEWTSLSGNTEICYYSGGQCDSKKLADYRKHKYIINSAVESGNPIVTYDAENDLWKSVNKDGYYFFFEDPYSVDQEDRRVSKVYRILNGKLVNGDAYNKGIYMFDDLFVERNDGAWEDAAVAVENVDAYSKRKCKAIETNELIEYEEMCYSDKLGLCMPKSPISDNTTYESNCMFVEDSVSYLHVVDGVLYLINDYTYQRVDGTGLYVIDQENLPFSSKIENESKAYDCVNGKCVAAKGLKSMYYMNSASLEFNYPTVLYYNSEINSWKKTDKNGNYFFNKKGYEVSPGEEATVFYYVKNNGNEIYESIVGENMKIISTNNNGNVYVTKKDDKLIVNEIASCTKESNGRIKSKAKLSVGDICMTDSKKMIFINKVEKSKRQEGNEEEEEELIYGGVESSDKQAKLVYIESENKLMVVKDSSVEYIEVSDGMVIIDVDEMAALKSTTAKAAVIYSCLEGKCTEVNESKLTSGKQYINSLSNVYPLVRYVGNGKFKVEDEVGYYFFDEKSIPVEVNVIPSIIYEVYKSNGEIVQENITEADIAGYFLNKANGNKLILSNNNDYWSTGMSINSCDVVSGEDGIICRTANENITYYAGNYCYKSNTKQLYLITADATNAGTTSNCVTGTNENPKYVYYNSNGGMLNSIAINNRLIQVDSNSIRVAKNGYYILDEEGNIYNENEAAPTEEGEQKSKPVIYKCDDIICEEAVIDEGEMIKTNNGEILK